MLTNSTTDRLTNLTGMTATLPILNSTRISSLLLRTKFHQTHPILKEASGFDESVVRFAFARHDNQPVTFGKLTGWLRLEKLRF
jgi:hypothetical protein